MHYLLWFNHIHILSGNGPDPKGVCYNWQQTRGAQQNVFRVKASAGKRHYCIFTQHLSDLWRFWNYFLLFFLLSFVSCFPAGGVRHCTSAGFSTESAEGALERETRDNGWLFWFGKKQNRDEGAGASAKESAVGGPRGSAASSCRLWLLPQNNYLILEKLVFV